MNLIKRALSLIIVFQLCWACNGSSSKSSGVVSTGGGTSSSTLTISGTISSLMDLVVASAVAQTGDLIVVDYTDPDNAVVLHSETLSGTNTFSVVLKKSAMAGGRLIKATYTSTDDPAEGSRTLLFNIAGTESTVAASMDSDSTMNSMLLDQQLIQEKNRGEIAGTDFLKRFKTIKNDDHNEEFEVLGTNKNAIKKLMLNPDYANGLADLMANMKYARQQGDLASIRDIEEKLFFEATDQGLISSRPILRCKGNKVSLMFRDQTFRVYFRGLDLEVMQGMGASFDFGYFPDSRGATDSINKYLTTLSEIGSKSGKILSAELYVESIDGPTFASSCRVFSEDMTAAAMAAAPLPSFAFEINRTQFNTFDASAYADLNTAVKYLSTVYMDAIKDLRDSIKLAVSQSELSGSDGQMMYVSGMRTAGDLYDQKFIESFNYFHPSGLTSNPYEANLSFIKNVNYDDFVGNFAAADKVSFNAFITGYDDIKERISEDGADVSLYELERSYVLLKQFYEMRKNQMSWWVNNNSL